jgi:hypothetical protein
MKRIFLFCLLALLATLPAVARPGPVALWQNPDGTVTLAWDPNTEADLAGYKIYWGATSGTYGTPVTIGKVTTFTTPKLANGAWFFAVTAHNTGGLESGFSNEVTCIVNVAPAPPGNLRIVNSPIAVMIAKKDATVSWKTNIAADSEISYGRIGFAQTMLKNREPTTDHSFRLTGLQPNQVWEYTVRSTFEGETVTATGSFMSK